MGKLTKDKKIVFYMGNNQSAEDGSIFFMKLASQIACQGKHKIYFINILNSQSMCYLNERVECLDVRNCNLSEFEGADFIVPFNYMIDFITHTQEIKYGHLLLLNWQPQVVDYLVAQFPEKRKDITSLLKMLNEKHAVAFMNENCRISSNKWLTKGFEPYYVPVFPSESIDPTPNYEPRERKKFQIGWLGRLDLNKIQSLINMLEAIRNSENITAIDLHIIGDGDQRGKINLERYTGKIRFIFTSCLYGEERDQYLLENIDLVVTTGETALDTSRLGIPTVIPVVQMSPFGGNQFVFPFDTAGFSLEWTKENLAALNYTTYTMGEVVQMLYQKNEKKRLGKACQQYCIENYNPEKSAKLLLAAVSNCELTIQDCKEHPVVIQQLKDFEKYHMLRKKYNRDYMTYILFVQKINQLKKKNFKQKIKMIYLTFINPHRMRLKQRVNESFGKLKQQIKKLLFKPIYLKRYKKVQRSYHAKIKSISEFYSKEKKLKVLFLVVFSSVFPSRPVFEKMLEDKNFDPYIMVIPDVQRSYKHKIETLNETFEELHRCYGDRVISGYDPKSETYREPDGDVKIAFFSNPYSRMVHKYHHITYFLDKDVLPIYINYGFAAIKYNYIILKTDFYNFCWKVCVESPVILEDLKIQQPLKGQNAFVTSYLKMDRYAQVETHNREKKLIIISPHHTVAGWKSLDISNFLTYCDFFLELPIRYPNIDFVFRPHPLLFNNLVESKIWSQKQIDNYIAQIESLPNMRYDHSGDYFELFANSDGMIHDCGSFIGEYLFTEKPCCYMLKNEQEIIEVMNTMGIACMKNYYKAYRKEDILRFIDEVILQGIDPLKNQREEFSKKELKCNYPHSADAVIRMLTETIQGK